MGDKFQNKSKHQKKTTNKEKKAQNHLKLMQGSKEKSSTVTTVTANFDKEKKAA